MANVDQIKATLVSQIGVMITQVECQIWWQQARKEVVVDFESDDAC